MKKQSDAPWITANQPKIHSVEMSEGDLFTTNYLNYFAVGSPACFQALKPPAMERTFL